MKTLPIFLITSIGLLGCFEPENGDEPKILFENVSAQKSDVDFANILIENDSVNYFNYGYIYMGGGVAIGDVNNDGLSDIYFTGNMVENKLYLNLGNMKFHDISQTSGVQADDRWVTGVTMADINADGWLDIYVSVSGVWATTKNLLYINKGLNDEGIPVFEEEAEKHGIADEGNSIQGVFFDYDADGDLDLHVSNYPPTEFNTNVSQYLLKMKDVTDMESNTLYENDGNGYFEDVTERAGIKNFGLTVSTAVGDFNNDGWLDLYELNDFAVPDRLYFNNGDGTFSEMLEKTMNQTSFFGMGTDAADFNNDGWLDLLQMDMTPADNRRSKANMQSMNVELFNRMTQRGFHYQYMRNSFQMNNGLDEDGLPRFSNIAGVSGMALTDWSWACTMADLDNDGWKDAVITNGTRREINNRDFFNLMNTKYKGNKKENMELLNILEEMPSEKVSNYAFKNNGDLSFSDKSHEWGLDFNGFSNGSAYGDLDNDGDLDLVINNLDDKAMIYENNSSSLLGRKYLKVKLIGPNKNPMGIGAKVTLFYQDKSQFQELIPTRGFQSSMEPVLHFGLGDTELVENVMVEWPGGKKEVQKNVKTNQWLELKYENAKESIGETKPSKEKKLFSDITEVIGIDHQHQENTFDDYLHQVLLPHKMSQFGPALAVADVDNDGLEDFYIGGATGYAGTIYKQNMDGTFATITTDKSWSEDDIRKEDVDAIFFDANGNGYADLYVVSGGSQFYKNTKGYQDRLYINNGKGEFVKDESALPSMFSNGSKVIAGDYDNDGDLDLFVGGRSVPRNYPMPDKSYILRNESSTNSVRFVNVTTEIAPDLLEVGIVADAQWVDINNDTQLDLVVVGEWMPISFFISENGSFENKTEEYGFTESTGWWYSVTCQDFDNDGDMDVVTGNLGLNYKYKASEEESFDIYVSDYDNNQSLDIVLGYYNNGEQYPVRGRECSSQQIPAIKVKFTNYESFANADLADIYSTKSLDESIHYQARNFASSYVENLGKGKFKMKNLTNEAQLSSVNSIISKDINGDGNLDLLLSGNLYTSEAETPRNDAGYGLYLVGDGKGNFKTLSNSQSGLFVSGDVKKSSIIKLTEGQEAVIFGKNDDYLQMVGIYR